MRGRARGRRRASDSRAAPPYAASTWNHRPSRSRERGELLDQVDRARVRRSGDGADRHRREPARPGPRRSPRRPARRGGGTASSAGQHDERLGREAQLVERAGDREVRLVAGVDADALEVAAARRPGRAAEPRAGGRRATSAIAMKFAITPPDVHSPNAPSPYPTRSHSQRTTSSSTNAPTGPACQTSMPWLVHWASTSPTIEATSGGGVKYDSARGWYAFSVCGAIRVVNSASTAPSGGGIRGAAAGPAGLAEVDAAGAPRSRWAAHRADHRLVVQPVEARRPGRRPGALERRPRGRGVADPDQLRLGVPAEPVERVIGGVVAIAAMVSGGGRRRARDRARLILVSHTDRCNRGGRDGRRPAGRGADDLVRRRAGRDGLAGDRVRLRGARTVARRAGRASSHGEMSTGHGVVMLATPTPAYENQLLHRAHCERGRGRGLPPRG